MHRYDVTSALDRSRRLDVTLRAALPSSGLCGATMPPGKEQSMNVILWTVQGLLVVVFGFSAIVKGTQSTRPASCSAHALAAVGLGTIMVPAGRIHLRRREPLTAVGNVVLLGLCVFVAIGRWPT
jgi:hypothetical protein